MEMGNLVLVSRILPICQLLSHAVFLVLGRGKSDWAKKWSSHLPPVQHGHREAGKGST